MKRAAFILIPIMLLGLCGCATFIVGGAVGALGGYAASNDTIQGESDKPYGNLWDSALTVSRIRGRIKYQDAQKGEIKLEAESSRVNIRLVRLTASTTRLKVKARKYHFPNMELAQDIFVKIMEQAK